MINFPLLHKTLSDYLSLSVFQDEHFSHLAEFKWASTFSSVGVGDKIYTTHEDALRAKIGLFFGYTFTLNSWLGAEAYKDLIDNLSGQAREDRMRSRTIIRKIFLENDGVKITDALSELHSNEWDIAKNTLEWAQMTSNDPSLNGFLHLGFEPEEIPDGFLIKRLGFFKNVTKEHLITQGVGVGDLFQLWLYSGDLHYDSVKAQLLNI